MFNDDQESLPSNHKLPLPFNSVKEYWDSFKKANEAIRADLREGKIGAKRITYKRAVPISPEIIGLDSITVPQIKAIGHGSGQPAWYTLREQQRFHMFAKADDQIKIDIQHLAGQKRAVGIQYVLMDSERRILRNEKVFQGATESFSVRGSRSGGYCLVVTGGTDGLAWYGVRIHNEHMGLLLPTNLFLYQPDGVLAYKEGFTGGCKSDY